MDLFDAGGTPALWAGFLGTVLVLLALDLGVFQRTPKKISFREAAAWSAFWVVLSLAFNLFISLRLGWDKGGEFLMAYVVEKSLSVDNIFVFVVIFRYMKVPSEHMQRVLIAGILGALALRGAFIFVGLGLIEAFEGLLYIFGGFLVYTGLKLMFFGEDDDEVVDASDNWVKRQAERHLRITRKFEGPVFVVRGVDGRFMFTTLFVTLLMIETSDVIFALDSIPAIFGISQDPFIVFTSNVCAILGLRAMFFLLESVIDRFKYLPRGLGVVLTFVGVKMILEKGLGGLGFYAAGLSPSPLLEPVHIPTGIALFGVFGVLTVSVIWSVVRSSNEQAGATAPDEDA
ncbi:MAG: TerC family protein [Nannocystaceae bacterium]